MEKKTQQQKLEDAINLHQGMMNNQNKKINHHQIINNFRHSNHQHKNSSPTHLLPQSNWPINTYWAQSKDASLFPLPSNSETNRIHNTIDLTTTAHDAIMTLMGTMIPKFVSYMNSITSTGTGVDYTSSHNETTRNIRKVRLWKYMQTVPNQH